VLKTSLTANIGGMLASSGYRVLLVDLDPQGNLAEDLGYAASDRDDEGRALAQGLMSGGTIAPSARSGPTPTSSPTDPSSAKPPPALAT